MGPQRASNDWPIKPPADLTLLDNTLLFLPEQAVRELCLEPNMNDKGDKEKYMWVGRIWELRALRSRLERETRQPNQVKVESNRFGELNKSLADPSLGPRLKRLAARWRGAAQRLRCSFSVLRPLKHSHLRGTLLYAHGSGGNSWDNYRICRMCCAMGMVVIVPDGFAYDASTPMGQLRNKKLQGLKRATDDVDYWADDLLYSSAAVGSYNYSTKAESVLEDPGEYKEMYEKCYQLRRLELHFIIARLPQWALSQGIFLGGTSEGAMTVARFDDQRYGKLIIGRFINSFSIEHCYFTPRPEDGELGGQLTVPTLNIIGTKDQFFGPSDSVAKIVAESKHGYGAKDMLGHGFETMKRQQVSVGLVCVLEDGVHSPCNTHDNFLRPLFHFFSRCQCISELHMHWQADAALRPLVQLVESSETERSSVTQLFVPLMAFPNRMTWREIQNAKQVAVLRREEAAIIEKERQRINALLRRAQDRALAGGAKANKGLGFFCCSSPVRD